MNTADSSSHNLANAMLPAFKPEPKFKIGDKVKTWKGVMLIQSHYGYGLIDKKWMPIYTCVRMNKKGMPDKRSANTRKNRFVNRFNEIDLSKA